LPKRWLDKPHWIHHWVYETTAKLDEKYNNLISACRPVPINETIKNTSGYGLYLGEVSGFNLAMNPFLLT